MQEKKKYLKEFAPDTWPEESSVRIEVSSNEKRTEKEGSRDHECRFLSRNLCMQEKQNPGKDSKGIQIPERGILAHLGKLTTRTF